MRKVKLCKGLVAALLLTSSGMIGMQTVKAESYEVTAYCGGTYGTGTFIYYADNNVYNTYTLNVRYYYTHKLSAGIIERDVVEKSVYETENNVRVSATAAARYTVVSPERTIATASKNGVRLGAVEKYPG